MDEIEKILEDVEAEGETILKTTGIVTSKQIEQMILERLNCNLGSDFE